MYKLLIQMRKHLFILAAWALALLTGCSKSELIGLDSLTADKRSSSELGLTVYQLDSLGLPTNVQIQYQKLLHEGLTADTVNNRINLYNDDDSLVAFINASKLTFIYHGFGGDIEAEENNTVAIFGRFNDTIHGFGTRVFVQGPNKLYGTGENLSGLNLLNMEDWTWEANKSWVIETANRGDIIRFISDPADLRNIYRNGVDGEKTVTGLEVAVLDSLGFEWNAALHQFVKN